MEYNNHGETLAVAFSIFTLLTGTRVKDCIRIFCNKFFKLPADETTPRRFKFTVDQTKIGMSWTVPEAGRTHLLPCSCLRLLSKSAGKVSQKHCSLI